MKATAFRIQMYRCVLDSGWIELEDLTAIVGRNESGKTALLEALHKFNPHAPAPYTPASEFPRGHREKRSPDQVVCSVRFKLEDAEVAELEEIAGAKLEDRGVVVHRDYEGKLEVEFNAGHFPERLHPNDIDEACAGLPDVPGGVGPEFSAEAAGGLERLRQLAREGRFTELESETTRLVTLLQNNRSHPQQQTPAHAAEQGFVDQLQPKVQVIRKHLASAKTGKEKAHNFVIDHLPTFIYMDDYRTFSGSARLDHVQSKRNKLSPEEETLVMLLQLAHLDLDTLVGQGNSDDREERQHDLNDAGITLTNLIEDRWRQRKYEVEFDADGQEFFTWVKGIDQKHKIKLEERSRGFQWFFSFDMLFMHESQGTFQGCVLLLDEPGLHLHPDGQRDLLRRLEEYARKNTLIYTTHLPFMLDLRRPERIRVLREDEGTGTLVSDDLTLTQPDEKLTLQAALGMSGRTSYLVAPRNLVVEGADDFWLITELSNLLARSQKDTLAEDIMITAAGGASEAAYIAALMIGQELKVAVLLDSDPAGDRAADKLVKKWLTRYKGSEASVLRLGEVVGETSCRVGIEDIFPADYYWAKVQEAYRRELAAVEIPEQLPPGPDMVTQRVESFFAAKGLTYKKGRVAKLIRADLRRMATSADLPAGVETKAEAVVAAVASALSEQSGA